jgi:hypothetical protein
MVRQIILAAPALILAAVLLKPESARADAVLYDSTQFVQGQQSFVQSFDITTAGTLTITLAAVPWLDTISGLNCFLSTSTAILGSSMGTGTESIKVTPGMIYAHWFGDANGALGVGVASMKVEFQPVGVTAVPLPASLVSMLAGLGVLFGWQRRRPADANSQQAMR